MGQCHRRHRLFIYDRIRRHDFSFSKIVWNIADFDPGVFGLSFPPVDVRISQQLNSLSIYLHNKLTHFL